VLVLVMLCAEEVVAGAEGEGEDMEPVVVLELMAAAVAARAAIVRILNCILIKRSENVEDEVNEVSWIISTSVCFR